MISLGASLISVTSVVRLRVDCAANARTPARLATIETMDCYKCGNGIRPALGFTYEDPFSGFLFAVGLTREFSLSAHEVPISILFIHNAWVRFSQFLGAGVPKALTIDRLSAYEWAWKLMTTQMAVVSEDRTQRQDGEAVQSSIGVAAGDMSWKCQLRTS